MAITKDVKLGKGVKIHHPELVNLYGCEIGDDCIIGAFTEIRKKVRIGDKVKIQAGVFIPEGVTVEDEVFIGPHVCFINDFFPRATSPDGNLKGSDDWEEVKTTIHRRASLGANSTIMCGVEIGEGSMVGAGSVVVKDVPAWTVVVGNPAKIVRKLESK